MIRFKLRPLFISLLALAIGLVGLSIFFILFFPEFQTIAINVYLFGYEALTNTHVPVFDEFLWYEGAYPNFQLFFHFGVSFIVVCFLICHILNLSQHFFWLTDDTCLIKRTFLFETIGMLVITIADSLLLFLTTAKGYRGIAGAGLGTVLCIASMVASLVIVAITNFLLYRRFKKEREKIFKTSLK